MNVIHNSVFTGPTDIVKSISNQNFDVLLASNDDSKYSMFELDNSATKFDPIGEFLDKSTVAGYDNTREMFERGLQEISRAFTESGPLRTTNS
jgi:hypothetical protein